MILSVWKGTDVCHLLFLQFLLLTAFYFFGDTGLLDRDRILLSK